MRKKPAIVLFMCYITLTSETIISSVTPKPEVRKELKHELEVAATADQVWSVYSAPWLPNHLPDLLPGAFEKLEIFGDGGVGTILDMTFPPGEFPHEYKEEFVLIDDEQRLKKVEMIEGGYLDIGVTYYMDTIHVVSTGPSSCVIRSSTEYYVKFQFAEIVEPLITTGPLAAMAEAISELVLKGMYEI